MLAAVEIERDGEADRYVVVGAQCLLAAQLEHRVRTQARLLQAPDGRVDLCARGAEIGAVGERADDELVHRDLGAGLGLSDAGGGKGRRHDE